MSRDAEHGTGSAVPQQQLYLKVRKWKLLVKITNSHVLYWQEAQNSVSLA